ncbi:MAG: SAM-dependent chlorinase/fluorinase [Gemmatimonadota bacterium]|nr:MAG: SAM-dependent chlorinase/fluorinase [Gemmatimonadota bacterium]
MAHNAIITLTTDFGTQDGYVGAMKGVILSMNSKAVIVDITHEIDAHDVLSGAFTLKNSCQSFPESTIHLAVVDPGVGSTRKSILLQTEKYFFLGPDNGVFSFVTREGEQVGVFELTESKYFLTPLSDTFHGRDIFAPVAGYLSLGIDPSEFGPELHDYVRISLPSPIVSESGIEGHIIHIDRFGNLVTNIDTESVDAFRTRGDIRIDVGSIALKNIARSYSEVEAGSPLAIVGSTGFLEIAVNKGSARQKLVLKRGDPVRVEMIS